MVFQLWYARDHEIEKFVDRFVTNNACKLQMQMQWEMRLIEDKIFGRAKCQRRANVGMGRSPGTVMSPEEREGAVAATFQYHREIHDSKKEEGAPECAKGL